MESKKSIFIECDCYAEGIKLSYEKEDKQLYISLYQRGFSPRTKTFKEKLRWIWRIITKDVPYDDEVILNLKKVQKIKSFLNSIV